MAEKLCINCKHVDLNDYICMHPVVKCVVTGNEKYRSCRGERGHYMDSYCRSEGRLFEKKEIQGSYGGEI